MTPKQHILQAIEELPDESGGDPGRGDEEPAGVPLVLVVQLVPVVPCGWDEARVRDVIEHHENQTEEEAVAEDEAAFADSTMKAVPPPLVPEKRELTARGEW
jgi:hypothetical protein